LLGLLSLYKKTNLSCLKLDEFQASETSLEQIFQLFAKLKLDDATSVLIEGHETKEVEIEEEHAAYSIDREED